MDEFAVEVTAKGADGSLEPFHIYVGAPETIDEIISGSLAFRLTARLVEYAGLTLPTTDGAPLHLPDPPDGCEEEG